MQYNSKLFDDELVAEAAKFLTEARLDTSPYESINDDPPKGKGVWTFSIDAYPSHPADYAKFEKNGTIVDYTDNYTDAVKKVQSAFPKAKVIYLLP